MDLTYHEKVARMMANSVSVGTYSSYEVILAALLKQMPDETELRAYIAKLEREVKDMGIMAEDEHYIKEEQQQPEEVKDMATDKEMSDNELQEFCNDPARVHYCGMAARVGLNGWITQVEFTFFKPDTEANNDFILSFIKFPFTKGEAPSMVNMWIMISVPVSHQERVEALLWQHGLRKVLPGNIPMVIDKDGQHWFPIKGPNIFYLENHNKGAENVMYKNDPERLEKAREHEKAFVEKFHEEHRAWLATPEGKAEAEAYWKKYNIEKGDPLPPPPGRRF